ncbi:gamma-glutamyl-gamma-aminobutyrate hydrolase family protein [Oceanicoccus sp. KOV_DT_Chl]|uniref:gamma-glutamyl-gamma-aminobutyrate hydrolase family protein n=1 Tax=Oceanicoccus sp. KOV_DT_Chl TaxID=1904639 RepID=UPI000C7DBB62|nr:gamma-glutamyl-gamma-aminobutyrate hydrolase family protein [Oceanicoccus sp. KOV_DT_Chl]
MAERPRVGVTGNSRRLSPSWICTRVALFLSGAKAVRISLKHHPETEDISALIIGGGDDISPIHYGLEMAPTVKSDPDRDLLEIRWIKKALDQNIPLLGICRGAQLINVVMGGTLHQDIRLLRKLTYNRPGLLPTKQVKLEPNCLLAKICGKNKLRVNSLHSQAVAEHAESLRVVGRDLDGIVQAMQSSQDRPVIGVQWHPEYLFYLPAQMALFRWLVKQ